MVQLGGHDKTTQCVVYDQTPDSEQKKINIVVRPAYTVAKVIGDIKTQYHYDKFELLMQPISGGDLVYLNDHQNELIYKVKGFEPQTKNVLVIVPHGKWDGDTKKRYEFPAKSSLKLVMNGSSNSIASSENYFSRKLFFINFRCHFNIHSKHSVVLDRCSKNIIVKTIDF